MNVGCLVPSRRFPMGRATDPLGRMVRAFHVGLSIGHFTDQGRWGLYEVYHTILM